MKMSTEFEANGRKLKQGVQSEPLEHAQYHTFYSCTHPQTIQYSNRLLPT